MKSKMKSSELLTIQSSVCYAYEDMRLYLQDKMSEDLTDVFETHCETCDKCASALWRQRQSDFNNHIADGDKELCKKFLDKIELLKQRDMPKDFGMKGRW